MLASFHFILFIDWKDTLENAANEGDVNDRTLIRLKT